MIHLYHFKELYNIKVSLNFTKVILFHIIFSKILQIMYLIYKYFMQNIKFYYFKKLIIHTIIIYIYQYFIFIIIFKDI